MGALYNAYDELKKYLQRKINEQEDYYLFRAYSDVNERQAHLIKILNDKPQTMFTVNELTMRFNITTKTARADLKHLVELGLMDVMPINKRTSGYIRSKNFEKRQKELLNF